MAQRLSGIMPAVASPCSEDDTFLEEEFAALVTCLYGHGIHGLYVGGGTGDGYNQRPDERKRGAEIACELGRQHQRKTIVHVGALNSREAMALAEHAAECGADALASMPPPTRGQAELVLYYRDICRAGQLPVIIYHIPALTGYTPNLENMLELLDIEGIVGLKATDWNLFFIRRLLLERPDICVFNGYDEYLALSLFYGATGGIGTFYNLFPELFLGIYRAVQAGDFDRALRLQMPFVELAHLFHRYGVRPVFELLMRQRGLAPFCFRRPRLELSSASLRSLQPLLVERLNALEKTIADETQPRP